MQPAISSQHVHTAAAHTRAVDVRCLCTPSVPAHGFFHYQSVLHSELRAVHAEYAVIARDGYMRAKCWTNRSPSALAQLAVSSASRQPIPAARLVELRPRGSHLACRSHLVEERYLIGGAQARPSPQAADSSAPAAARAPCVMCALMLPAA